MMINNKEVPTGVRIISIIYYLFALLALILGIFLALVTFAGLGIGILILAIVISLPFAFLFFFIGRDISRGKKTAKIIVLIIAFIGVFGSISYIFYGAYTGIISLVINGFIAGYLLFSKESKEFFK